ncbi:MAG TPA: tetratricopeptide repeat protein [Candidatus Angelobacter sp.]
MGISSILAAALVLISAIGSSFAIGSSVSITQLSVYPITQFSQLTNFLLQRGRQRPQTSDELQQAESLLQNQKYAEAEVQLQSLTATQGENPQVWFDLGFTESHLGKTSEASAAYKKAVDLSPTWFEANLNLGLTLAKAGNRADAATALRAATALKPTTNPVGQGSNAWLSLGQVLEESDPNEALAAYQKALEINPANIEAAAGAGKLLEARDNIAEAEKVYLVAANLGGSSGMERLVSLYIRQKRLSDAESWLRKYLAANPQNAAAQVQLGRLLATEGKTKEAITELQGTNSSAADPAISRELSSLYLEDKQYDAAAIILRDLVQKNPKEGELHCNLGSAFLHQHNYAEAEAELIQGLNLNPRLDNAYWELAFAAQQNKHYELAIRVLDARGKRLPEIASTYWIRAVAYDSLGAFKPAAENYKLFLASDGGKLPDEEFKARHRLKAIEH